MGQLSYDIAIEKHHRNLVQIQDFQLEENHITFLFGESGIGKSLIAKALYGLLSPEEFRITINAEPYSRYLLQPYVSSIQQNSFFVFQEPSSHLNPLQTLQAQLLEGETAQDMDVSPILQRLWDTRSTQSVQNMLSIFPKPYRPSGGEKQRLLLSMAFLKMEKAQTALSTQEHSLFVFDEPSGSLDNHFRDLFLSYLFENYQKHPCTILFITHDYSIINAVRRLDPSIMRQVSFKELTMGKEGLVLHDFFPDHYAGWIEDLRRDQRRIKLLPSQPILKVESGVEVFGRVLNISKHPSGTPSCPLEISPSTLTYLKAPSGMGKTTFAKSMMGLIRTQHVRMKLQDLTFTERTSRNFWQTHVWGSRMTMTFQHADEALNESSTVEGVFSGLPGPMRTREYILDVMRDMYDYQLDESFLKKKVKYLSGGQKQKLNLLRGLILDTDLLILDEPFNGLDFESIKKVLVLIREKQEQGKGILIISHNEEIFHAVVNPEQVYYITAVPSSPAKKA